MIGRCRPAHLAGVLGLVAVLLAGCASGPILANAPVVRPSPPATPAPPSAPPDPQPVVLPRDDGPHSRLTEWWYYTGHLRDVVSGRRYGFEFVVFRAERGEFPVSWASHLAITDQSGDRFIYGQRSEIGPRVDASPRSPSGEPTGFALSLDATDPATGLPTGGEAWSMSGADGRDRLAATMSPAEGVSTGARPLTGSSGLSLTLAATRPAVLHDGDGWIDFGPAGGSYYYSRTRMTANGDLTVDGRTFRVDGTAWFDHQWGDFISVGGGGWDWFAVNLADGTDVTLSLVRDATGDHPLAYGTLIRPDGSVRHLPASSFDVAVTGRWTSHRSGATYPAGWTLTIPGERLSIGLSPTVAAQELDTRATTGVVYWEGSQRVTATHDGRAVAGQAYVELTGYATASTPGSPSSPSPAPSSPAGP